MVVNLSVFVKAKAHCAIGYCFAVKLMYHTQCLPRAWDLALKLWCFVKYIISMMFAILFSRRCNFEIMLLDLAVKVVGV